jgi:hypothetical protein
MTQEIGMLILLHRIRFRFCSNDIHHTIAGIEQLLPVNDVDGDGSIPGTFQFKHLPATVAFVYPIS